MLPTRRAMLGPRAAAALAVLLASSILPGCGRDDPPGHAVAVVPAVTPALAPIVATIGGRTLTADEADAPIAGALGELDHQRYLLRRQAIEALLLRELTASDASVRTARIHVSPPLPAPIPLPGAAAALRPAAARPVTITVFCNFESPHCAALQGMLADLLGLYPESLRIALRDLPLPMHRHAPDAAEAARCAGLQGRYWNFHDLLWARARVPDRAELELVARAIGLDTAGFRQCLEAHSQAAAVARDMALAQQLGLGAVPAVFVNGRAAFPPATVDQLVWLVEQELAQAGTSRDDTAVRVPTQLPLGLRATIVGDAQGLGVAVIGGTAPDSSASLRREGERVAPQAILRRVASDHVELLVAGVVEILSSTAVVPSEDPAGAAGPDPDANVQASMALPRTSPMPVFLDRQQVRERMADRVALSGRLAPVPMTVDGYRLLQLGEVPPGSLYELLGLQPGDVIVAVNEQPIHEGDNPLWDALDREAEVRVRVMRRGGIAQHYTYRFE